MTIGEKIKSVRLEKGLSQRKLQEITGISYTTISRIENNQGEPSFAILEKLAEAFGVTVGYITDYEGEIDPQVLRMIGEFKQLNPGQKEAVLKYIRNEQVEENAA